MTNEELIAKAAGVIKKKQAGDLLMADVGSALIAGNGKVYTGVCINTKASMGFCAETNAIGSMITDGEYKIKKIVATWKDDKGGVYAIPPCGICREYIKQIDKSNLETEVILDKNKIVKLKDLLPYHDWWQKIT